MTLAYTPCPAQLSKHDSGYREESMGEAMHTHVPLTIAFRQLWRLVAVGSILRRLE